MTYMFKGKEVEVDGIAGEAGEGACAESAVFVECGTELTDTELDQFNDLNASELYEAWYQNQVMRAEAMYEGDR
jgi:hypothetical protein